MASASPAIEYEELSGKKFYSRDFSGQNLAKRKMRGSVFYRCNFDKADLSETDAEGTDFTCSSFVGTKLYRANWKDCKLGGVIFAPSDAMGLCWSLTCKTFDGMSVDPIWAYAYLYFFCIMKHTGQTADLPDKIIAAIGVERFVKLTALFSKRELLVWITLGAGILLGNHTGASA